ncbi:MAG TPA: 2-hydroxyacyl-CoA dehydratase [Firmicutes bacterium]|nr:2-hydroxyacyl-CoA dehydratase [Bacillota bacterium]
MKKQTEQKPTADFTRPYPVFTPAMKATHTILIPDMLPWHFDLLVHVMQRSGYRVEVLHNEGRAVIDEGLKHVHNDTCFPALCVIGQYLDALKSGKYDPDRTAVLITQSGGGCRASNYIPLIRKAMAAEFPQVPVLSLNFSGLEKGNGLQLTLTDLIKLAYAIFYGDLVMTCYNQTKPYEEEDGSAARVRTECVERLKRALDDGSFRKLGRCTKMVLNAFAAVRVRREEKVKVGIVGEIYVKYSPLGNSHLEDFLLSEGCEPVVPALMDFILYCVINNINDAKFYHKGKKTAWLFAIVYRWLYGKQKKIIALMKKQGRFEPLHDFEHLRRCADKVINQGVKMGEGWLIPAEMAALAETGTDNIVCAQPFGCLPNHIAGKGAVRALKQLYEHENIVPVDYDPSATRVNQENRIKLMLATARENLRAKQEERR